jgi:putative ABC transport system substrate-binding protein
MRRRQFIAGLGSAATWPLAARAQQAERVRRIGMLLSGNESDPAYKSRVSGFGQTLAGVSAFTQALGDFGWTDGRRWTFGGTAMTSIGH